MRFDALPADELVSHNNIMAQKCRSEVR